MLTASTRLGPYEIVAPLGAGGMGEVYRARDTRLGREVAIKVLPDLYACNPDRQARFEREAKAVAALSHPNILAIHDYGTDGNVTYAVMELLEGETLCGRLAKGPLPWREAIEIGAAIAEGLAAAHAKGIIHRDLKPENLFLTSDGRVKILDFGLARITPHPEARSETGPYVAAATGASAVLGTVGYMSPEQVRGEPADVRSDLFSFGCVLYEMVTGKRAFQRTTAAETMTAILHEEPQGPMGSDHQIPMELGRVIRQCLAKSPNQRLQSARDLALGLRATASDPGLHRPPPANRRFSPIIAIVAASLLIGGIGTAAYFLTRSGNRPETGNPPEEAKAIEAVAVLPFENVGGDPKTEHLSEGIPDTIIHGLSRLRQRDLKVRPFTSVARYKGRKPDLQEAGRELGVRAVVTGRLELRGDSLYVSVALIDVREDSELWGKQYDRKLNDILALQDEIAKDIAANLRLGLTGEEERRLTKRYTENTEAYQLYLKGRYFWNKRTQEQINKARSCFEQAIEKDPGYALAYAGLADCYVVPANPLPPRERMPKARAAAMKALELDDTLAEAHTTLARVLTIYDWDWSGAKKEFQRAIELNPRYAVAHQWYGAYWTAIGRPDEGIAENKRARELDPFSLSINFELALVFYYAREYDQAIEQFRKTLEMDTSFGPAQQCLPAAYEQKEMYTEAITGFQKAITPTRGFGRSISMAGLGHVYAVSGKKIEAQKVLNELKEMSSQQYVPAHEIALIYAGLGEKDQAFAWLEKAYDERSFLMFWLKVEPRWLGFHSDPRFAGLLSRMGLADKAAERNQAIQSVAVLPFKNVGGDPKTEFLSDGVADQIINSLSQVRRHDLKVRPFTSVARYKGKEPDVPTFGRELNTQMIVTGTLHQQGDDLSISVALVDVREDNQLWGHTYRGKLGAILDFQDQIARDVAANLRLGLTGKEEQRLTKRYTEDPEAYLLYREGVYHMHKFTEAGLATAVEYYQRALKKDPKYALALVGLGRSYIVLGMLHRGPRQTHPEARKHLIQALEIDPGVPGAQAGLGTISLIHDWDWPAAERALKESGGDLDPSLPTRAVYGFYLAAMGRPADALPVIRQAQELNPLAAAHFNELAMCYNWMRQYDKAIAEARKAIELDPNFFLAYGELGRAYAEKGMHSQAIAELQKGLDLGKGHPRIRGLLGYAYAAAGQTAEARKALKELKGLSNRYGYAFAIARIHTALGEKDQAFEWLRKACDERDSGVIYLKVDPTMENLRSDTRFAQLLKDMGLAP